MACFIAVSSTSFAQVHFPDTTHQQTWEVKTWYWFSCKTNIYKTGNTVNFCQNQYIEIFKCDGLEQNCTLYGYYRNSGATVRLRKKIVDCNEQEILVYDFSANVGQVVYGKVNVTKYSCTHTDFTVQSSQPVQYEGVARNTQDSNNTSHPYANPLINTE